MVEKVWHVIGNGDLAAVYKFRERVGKKLICNMPPFEMPASEVYGTAMVDFKMMSALEEGQVNLGKYAPNVREFYTDVPKYAKNATNFNCGMMAVHYAIHKKKADVVHMYGFDTLFDFNMRSITDLYLNSDRGNINNFRLIENWRPVWNGIFKEAEKTTGTKFILHHNHDKLKITTRDNMSVETYDLKEEKKKSKIKSSGEEITKEQFNNMNRHQKRAYEAQLRKGILG